MIIVLLLQSTYRLQLLDIGLFLPLAIAYTNGLNSLIHKSLSIVSMSKRMFWSLFQAAWTQSFTAKNIASAFKTTGIFPFNPDPMLATIQKPTSLKPVNI